MDEINALPDHILVEVFGNLSPKMIKSCSLVCKRWDEIIGNSRKLMGRFQLNLSKPQNDIKEAKQIRRNHQAAIVKSLSGVSLDVISRHKLQSLKMDLSMKSIKLSTLIEALNRLPSLKVFDASYKKIVDDIMESNNFKKVQINLEELRCSVEIIHIFECCTVKILKMKWKSEVEYNRKMLAIDFLKRQKNLEEFYLHGWSSSEFFTIPEIFELKFALNKLRVNCLGTVLLHYEAFIKFLQQHKRTLTNLEIDLHTEPKFVIELIHKFALENLLNLKYLKLGYIENDDDLELSFDELPSATQVTRNIESLALNARSTDMNENKRFFAMFPNLKTLNFGGQDENDIKLLFCISAINVNVETLQIWDLGDEVEFVAKVYFPKLKEFSVEDFCEEINLSSFINRHSKTLEKITINYTYNTTHLTTTEILNCANLKYLELDLFEPSFSVIGMLDEISAKTKQFTLILNIRSSKLAFNFPDDKAIWDEEVKQLKKKIYASSCLVQ